ncbi:hypothetical protein CDD81_5711 [Ophiocordyceps australis]|uniref:Conserved oligomeric Golgi complex subunit 6 n=1 Tax=Ophiocordyceps australis TaxID=1399860 RepID=A0A2C5XMS1_9HYPO|nr:hypothetical protein CDD81_5711 [Ophiocordyceps australis]
MDLLGTQRLGDDAFSRTNGSYGNGPLGARIAHVLSASYSDTEFSQILQLLDESPLRNDAATRRQIRLQAERRVIDYNGAALDNFERVAQQLRRLNTIRERVNGLYHATRRNVAPAHERTQPHLEEAIALLQQRHRLQVKQRILAVVNQRFVMPEDHIVLLTSSAHQVDDAFFEVLDKVKQIRRDCELLLGFENQTLGSDLMEQTSANINLAFQKLHTWLQRQFKALNLESTQINSTVRCALRSLAERPSLFRSCLSLFGEARERTLSNAFHAALTGTTTSGISDLSVKPIDLGAHDSLRYVGDMLAWVHSATVSEREALEVLFLAEGQQLGQRFKTGHVKESWCRLTDSKGNDGHDCNNHLEGSTVFNPLVALNELVDQDIKGACQLLRQRVEQVIRSSEETIIAYKLAALIAFYRITFIKA